MHFAAKSLPQALPIKTVSSFYCWCIYIYCLNNLQLQLHFLCCYVVNTRNPLRDNDEAKWKEVSEGKFKPITAFKDKNIKLILTG